MPDTDMPNNRSTKKPGYAIIYGLAEGPYMSRQLRQLLEKAGFHPTDAKHADLIIAHSGGSFILPKHTSAKLFIHVNPSYWPGKSLLRSLVQKLEYDFRLYRQRHQLSRWLATLGANIGYLLNLPRLVRMAWPYIRARKTLNHLPDSSHIFIRTYVDSYCNPKALFDITSGQHRYLTLTGHHDDCWREPEQYVQLVRALYN
jgi:hypothetical protein